MPRYYKQEIVDLNHTGEKQYRYEIHSWGTIDTEGIARIMHKKMHLLSEGDFVAIAREMVETIAQQLAAGYSVTLDGLGSFSLSLGLNEYSKNTAKSRQGGEPTARRVGVKRVNFKTNPKFVQNVDALCQGSFIRDRKGIRPLRKPAVPREQRIQRAIDFIHQHGMLRVMDYVELSGLSRTAASLELREFMSDPAVPITGTGRGSHRVYIEVKVES